MKTDGTEALRLLRSIDFDKCLTVQELLTAILTV